MKENDSEIITRKEKLLFEENKLLFFLIPNWLLRVLKSTMRQGTEYLQTVFGIAGKKALLPCNISPPTFDDSVALVLWYKDEATTPSYSLDARRGSLNQARHAPNDVLARRAYLSISRHPAVLQLDPLLEEDEGFYRCRVDFKKARTRNSDVILTVLVPPKKPVITDHSGEVLQSLIGPYNEGDRLILICEAEGGKPSPMVTWWRESVLLDDTYYVSPLGVVRNELELPSLQRHDLMAVFACKASNSNYSHPSSTSVTVDMNFRPLQAEIEGERVALSAGVTVELTCKVVGSRPPAVISWWFDKRQLKQTRESVSIDGYVTTSSLSFTPSREDHGNKLSCRAQNPYMPSSIVQDTWQLQVHYPPHVSLRLGSELHQSQIYEGSDIYFKCNIVSNPPPTIIQWQFNREELLHNVSNGIIIANHSLVIQKIQRRHKGNYRCLATNKEGQAESNAVYLRVQYSPFCKQGQKILYGAARHETIQVICELDADPSEVKFRWEFNNSIENFELVNFKSKGTTGIATYVLRSQHDYGTLLCWGKNEVGLQRQPCVYTVVPAGPPDSVGNCTVTNQTEDAIALECRPGYDGGLKQHFLLEIHNTIQHQPIANMTADVPRFLVDNLPASTILIVTVYAVNNKGRSNAAMVTTYTLPIPKSMTDYDSWNFQLSPVMIAVSSVVIVVALSILFIALIVRCRTKYYLKVKSTNRVDKKEAKEDQLDLRQSFAEEKCPDLIPEKKFKDEEVKLLEESLQPTNVTTPEISEKQAQEEEKVQYSFVHPTSASPECQMDSMDSALLRIPVTRSKGPRRTLQTEV